MAKVGAVKSALRTMESMGGKFPVFSKAVRFLAPLITANMLFEGFRQIPGLNTVMEKIDDVDAFVRKNTLGKIPVLKWSYGLKSLIKNRLSGGDKSLDDYVDTGAKEEENDRSWYEPGYSMTIPTNEDRPIDFSMVNLFNPSKSSLFGGIPKLSRLLVGGFDVIKSKSLHNTFDKVYQAIRDNLKTNMPYSENKLIQVLMNSANLYIIVKQMERRLGFTKFIDPQFKQFYDLWKRLDVRAYNYGVYSTQVNPWLDINSEEYSVTYDIYQKIASQVHRFVLPSHLKDWIDHYLGSIFVLDDDVSNCKYCYVSVDSVKWIDIDNQQQLSSVDISINDDSLNPRVVYDLLDDFFHDSLNEVIFSDFRKAVANSKGIWKITGFTEGWMSDMDNYAPTPIQDVGFKQALINAYTDNNAVDARGYVRLDRIAEAKDDLTTYIFGGALFNEADLVDVYGSKTFTVKSLQVLIYADSSNTVTVPTSFIQRAYSSDNHVISDIVCFVLQTTVYTDRYIGVNAFEIPTGDRYYGPTPEYEVLTPSTKYYNANMHIDKATYSLSGLLTTTLLLDSDVVTIVLPIHYTADGVLRFKYKTTTRGDLLSGLRVESSDWSELQGTSDPDTIAFVLKMDGAPFLFKGSTIPGIFSDSSLKFGYIGYIKFSMNLNNWVVSEWNITTANLTLQLAPESDPVTIGWTTSIFIPNSDISDQYVITESTTTVSGYPSYTVGYSNYSQTLFTELGYCIPVTPMERTHVLQQNSTFSFIDNDRKILYKEDYIPFVINVNDMPVIIDTMFDGLFNWVIIPNVEVANKNE